VIIACGLYLLAEEEKRKTKWKHWIPWQTLSGFTLATCIWDLYASGNKLPGTPRGSRKKPNAGRLPTCRLWTADANSHTPCRLYAVPLPQPCRGLERSLLERHIRDMACMNQTRSHCVNEMRNTQSKLLAERHGKGTAWYVWIRHKSAYLGDIKHTELKMLQQQIYL
jgi:hypothetical protein